MPIVLAHSPSPAAVGSAGYQIGEGRRRERGVAQRNQLALSYEQLNQQAASRAASESNAMMRFYDSLAARQQFAADRRDASREYQEFQLLQQGMANDTRLQLAEMQMESRAAHDAEIQQARRREETGRAVRDGLAFYTPEQKLRLSRLQNELGNLGTNNRLNPGQQRDASRALQQQIDGILANPQWRSPDDRPMSTEEQVKQKLYFDEGGQPWTISKDGEVQVPRGWSAPKEEKEDVVSKDKQAELEFKRQQSIAKAAIELFDSTIETKDAKGKPLHHPRFKSMEEARRAAEKLYPREQAAGQPQQPQSQAPPKHQPLAIIGGEDLISKYQSISKQRADLLKQHGELRKELRKADGSRSRIEQKRIAEAKEEIRSNMRARNRMERELESIEKELKNRRDMMIRQKNPGVRRLEARGRNTDDLIRAQMQLQGIKKDYPNIKSLSELPQEVQRQVQQLIRIINAANGN